MAPQCVPLSVVIFSLIIGKILYCPINSSFAHMPEYYSTYNIWVDLSFLLLDVRGKLGHTLEMYLIF